MNVSVSFIDSQTNETLHGINCECEEVYSAFAEGQEVQIHGSMYIVHHTVRVMNGCTTFKVYVQKKSIY